MGQQDRRAKVHIDLPLNLRQGRFYQLLFQVNATIVYQDIDPVEP
jgi:hypothetical protein